MSGGSYDYLYRSMEDGKVDQFGEWAEALAGDLRELATMIEDGKVEGNVRDAAGKYLGRCPYQRVAEAQIAIPAAIARVEHARRLLADLQTAVRELAPIAHGVEWWRSCDTGPDDPVDESIAWMQRRLGVTP